MLIDRLRSLFLRVGIDLQEHEFKRGIPQTVVAAALIMSMSAILQAFSDIFLESLSLIGVIKLPFRIDFLSLTLLSALLAYHALKGIVRKEFDVTHDAAQVSVFVEAALIAGDMYLLWNSPQFLVFRFPFIILTCMNVALLFYIVIRLKLFWGKGT
jgi:hypothetical protein